MKLLWSFLLGLCILDNPFYSLIVSVSGQSSGNNTTLGVKKLKFRELHRYRKVHWCLTGWDEPELHQWPFNQFVPLLRRGTQRFHISEDVRYSLKFYEIKTEQKDMGNNGGLYKTVHIIFSAEERRDINANILEKWNPMPIEGLIIQANYNPDSLGMPAGEFIEMGKDVICQDCNATHWGDVVPCRKRSIVHMVHPTVSVFHHEMKPVKYIRRVKVVGKQSEVHVDFRWYNPNCAETRRFVFYLLAVRSFESNLYDVIKMGPYEVAVRDQNYQSDISPSPYFLVYSQNATCHGASSTDIQTEHPLKFNPFEMSSKYDCCTQNERNPRNPSLKLYQNVDPSFNCTAAASGASAKNPFTINLGSESWICGFPAPIKCRYNSPHEKADKYYTQCEPCRYPESTTTVLPTKKPHTLIKRTIHGMLMIMTNFCLQPIVIYIARFYKETYNTIVGKGTKSWYWMHMLGGMVSSTMVYFGYFSGGSEKDFKAHVILGNIYILILAFCYMTAWGRNKNSLINIIMEFCHGCLGYTVITMAIVSIATSPNLGDASKLCIYLMVGFQVIFMMAMTCHICCLDKEFGMKPKRRHFPTIEARFDEVKVPGGKFRKTMLTIFAFTTFTLSLTSTFIE